MRLRPALLLVLLPCAACPAPKAPLPKGADGVAHFLFADYAGAPGADVAGSVAELHDALGGAELAQRSFTSLDPLTVDDLHETGRTDDPSGTQGIAMLGVLPCTFDQLVPILASLDQKDLYPDTYDKYDRAYTTDKAAFDAHRVEALAWTVDIDLKLAGFAPYSAEVTGGLRRIEAIDEATTPFGPILIARSYFQAPAEFEEGSSNSYPFDAHIEAYWERAPSELLHFWASWREFHLGESFSSSDDAVVDIAADQLGKWDDETAAHCAGD